MTAKPDLVTFHTDFNVTFGVSICFDLMFYWPPVALIERGVRNFVFQTMWFSQLPYLSGKHFNNISTFFNFNKKFHQQFSFFVATQYQQSWAYAANVNLLAANINWPSLNCSGSGIYAGRLGALEVFYSRFATTKVLIAKVPVDPQSSAAENIPSKMDVIENPVLIEENLQTIDETPSNEADRNKVEIDKHFSQDNLKVFAIEFLDFSKKLYHEGRVCQDGICCYYDIVISRDRMKTEKVRSFEVV